jgi:threonine/homoserine/homoserine lactone efflux protein
VGTIVERSATVFTATRLAGALYLSWLGIQAFGQRGALAEVMLAGADEVHHGAEISLMRDLCRCRASLASQR